MPHTPMCSFQKSFSLKILIGLQAFVDRLIYKNLAAARSHTDMG